MGIHTEIPLETAIDYIGRGIDEEMRKRIISRLMPIAEKAVEQVAADMLRDLKVKMQGYRNHADGDIHVFLMIDGKKTEIK